MGGVSGIGEGCSSFIGEVIGRDNTGGCDGDLLEALGVRGICCGVGVGNPLGETSTETLDRGLLFSSRIDSTSGSIFCSSKLGEALALPSMRLRGIAELLLLLALVAFSSNSRSSHNPADISSMSWSNSEHLLSSSRICWDIILRYCSYSRDARILTTGDLSEFDSAAGGVLAFLFRVAGGELVPPSTSSGSSLSPSFDSASFSWEK